MARIRTVKPEFWLNEQLAGLDCHARLLAIALLNQCDDGGYFRANVALVRSSCMPFDDDAEHVRRSLNALAAIGYIEIRRTDAGKEIGRVCKFLDHQKIDKAQESKFAADFHDCRSEDPERGDHSPNTLGTFDDASPNDRRSIDDASPIDPESIDDQSAIVRRLEQGTGKGNREAEKEKGSGNSIVANRDEESFGLASLMADLVKEVAPKEKPPNLVNWSRVLRLMRDRDGHTFAEIEKVFRWANADPFWRTNIRCPEKLRGKFGILHAKMTNPIPSYSKPKANIGPGVTFDPLVNAGGTF